MASQFINNQDITDHVKHWMDFSAAGVTFMSVMQWLPEVLTAISMLFSIIWYLFRFYEYFKKK